VCPGATAGSSEPGMSAEIRSCRTIRPQPMIMFSLNNSPGAIGRTHVGSPQWAHCMHACVGNLNNFRLYFSSGKTTGTQCGEKDSMSSISTIL